jgi:hypothetical protein
MIVGSGKFRCPVNADWAKLIDVRHKPPGVPHKRGRSYPARPC